MGPPEESTTIRYYNSLLYTIAHLNYHFSLKWLCHQLPPNNTPRSNIGEQEKTGDINRDLSEDNTSAFTCFTSYLNNTLNKDIVFYLTTPSVKIMSRKTDTKIFLQ